MPDHHHPVFAQLLAQVEGLRHLAATAPSEGRFAGYTGVTIEPYVIEHGRPFTGIKRPKGYRRRAEKQCFHNAAMLAIEGKGTYVEGYAVSPTSGILIHHAWVTADDARAIDVTWTDPEQAAYFGVPIPNIVLAKLLFHDLLSPLQRIVFEK
jgi:hypothetical protein